MRKLIQWPRAKYWTRAWNPVIGCRAVSPACENCYAKAWAERFGQSFEPHETKSTRPPRTGVVFCGNMTDLFGDWHLVHEGGGYIHKACDWIAETLGRDKRNPYKDRATYLWLTKRPGLMAEWVTDGGWEEYHDYWTGEVDGPDFKDCDMSNQFFGFTAESQAYFNLRMDITDLMWPKWARLWLSCEPLLGPIDLTSGGTRLIPGFSWVVIGCESGPKRRPCKVEWVEGIVEQCMGAGVPCFVKQLDLGGKCVTDIDRFPEHLRVRQVPWVGEEVEA